MYLVVIQKCKWLVYSPPPPSQRKVELCIHRLVPDVMHDILEGALQHEAKLMLKKMLEIDKYFSLGTNFFFIWYTLHCTIDTFNMRLVNTELGYMEAAHQLLQALSPAQDIP